MWKLYDELISAIPDDITIKDCVLGVNWTMVRSIGTGLAMTPPTERRTTIPISGNIAGKPVAQIAQLIKSWNIFEATIGVAAINSVFNSIENVKQTYKIDIKNHVNIFDDMQEEIAEKKVAVIGHFPNIERWDTLCQLSVLERRPLPGDLPDPACEYILPEQDYVFITGTTLANKTLPRLLQLSRNACTVLVGPSVPLSPIMFRYGADVLGSTVVFDSQTLKQGLQEGGSSDMLSKYGKMVKVMENQI